MGFSLLWGGGDPTPPPRTPAESAQRTGKRLVVTGVCYSSVMVPEGVFSHQNAPFHTFNTCTPTIPPPATETKERMAITCPSERGGPPSGTTSSC